MSAQPSPPSPSPPLGLVELSVIAGAFLVLVQVTWPQLQQVPWRAQQAEAKEVLSAAAAGARAHFVRLGSYRCGACDATVPSGARYIYLWAAAPDHPEPCARTAPALAAGQSDGHFCAAATRPIGQHACEVWQVRGDAGLRRHLVPRPSS